MVPTAFICYAHEDELAAKKIFATLSKLGSIEPWLDKECLRAGQRWRDIIPDVIRKAKFFVALLSRKSTTTRGFVVREIKIALEVLEEIPDDDIFLIPLRIEECDVPNRLAELHYVDLFPDFEAGLQKALIALNVGYEYLGLIDRTRHIATLLTKAADEWSQTNRPMTVRARGAFGHASNVPHYSTKTVPELNASQLPHLDNLLVRERECFLRLVNLDNVTLKLICWPNLDYLEYYTDAERRQRASLLRKFFVDSANVHAGRRDIILDKTGAGGNLLIVGEQEAIVANPRSGGYRKTSTFTAQPVVHALIREFDNLFNRVSELGQYGSVRSMLAFLDDQLK